ncbi:hypothetical protein FWF48_03740, partial [Candidatus Saccharibacteria bacterium]|nr:hypothetical protein [Candidatus Saccharibacteria bacterium]
MPPIQDTEKPDGESTDESSAEDDKTFAERYGFDPDNLRTVLVDQTIDGRNFARDYADHRLDKELGETKGFRGKLAKIWKGNYAKEYYRQKYTREAMQDIAGLQNIYAMEGSEGDVARARIATIQRFQNEYEDMIHNGEQRHDITSEAGERVAELKGAIAAFAGSNGNEDALHNLEEARKRIITEFAVDGNENLNDLVMIDNITDIAEQARLAVEHGFALENVMAGMQIINGESRSGVRGEAKKNAVDKASEWLQKNSRGLVNPTTIATAVSVAACCGKWGGRTVIGKALAVSVPGVSAAVFAGHSESIKLKDERAQHMREMAQGKEASSSDKARAELDATMYDMRSATDMTSELSDQMGLINDLLERKEDLTPDRERLIAEVTQSLATVDARVRISDQKGIDLIQYSDVLNVEEERFALDNMRAKIRVALLNYHHEALGDQAWAEQGGDEAFKAHMSDMADSIAEVVDMKEDISAKDKGYKHLRNRRVTKAAGVAFGTGLVFGLATQEATAFVNNNVSGALETVINNARGVHTSGTRGTLLFNVLGMRQSNSSGNVIKDTLVNNADGTKSFVDARDGNRVDGIVRNSHTGRYTAESINKMHAKGYTVVESQQRVIEPQTPRTEAVTRSVSEYLKDSPDKVTKVTRKFWFDNDTPNKFDHSELRLYANGKTPDGKLSFSMGLDGYQPHHAGNAIDLHQEAAAGKLFAQIIPSRNHQGEAIMVQLNSNGTLAVNQNSELAQYFSPDGKVLKGAFMEMVYVPGKVEKNVADGITHLATASGGPVETVPVATWVGKNALENITSMKTVPLPDIVKTIWHTEIIGPSLVPLAEMPPIIPIVPRRSLLAAERRRISTYSDGSGYDGYTDSYGEGYEGSSENSSLYEHIKSEVSPSLRDDPDADLQLGQEVGFYKKQLAERTSPAYIDSIETSIEHTPELNDHLDNYIKSIVAIPVHATAESDKIFDTLKLYAKQEGGVSDSNIVALYLNWRQDENTPENDSKIQATRSEIERARSAFPQLKLAVFEHANTVDEVGTTADPELTGSIARRMNDTIMLALQKSIQDGQMSADHDVLIIRNDADAKGMSREYIENMQKAAEQNPDVDSFTGHTRFDTMSYADTPGFGIVTNFMMGANAIAERYGNVHTAGANFAYRASAYAAMGGIGFTSGGVGSDDLAIGRRLSVVRDRASDTEGAWDTNDYRGGAMVSTKKRVVKRITGATIDTNGDKYMGVYLQDRPIYDAYKDYGLGGNRSAELSQDQKQTENIRKRSDFEK